MNATLRSSLVKRLAVTSMVTLLALGVSSEALARGGDHHGRRGYDRGHHHGHHHRGHHHWKGYHRHHYRYPRHYYPRYRDRHYYYGYPYELFGLGLLTGYLLDEYD